MPTLSVGWSTVEVSHCWQLQYISYEATLILAVKLSHRHIGYHRKLIVKNKLQIITYFYNISHKVFIDFTLGNTVLLALNASLVSVTLTYLFPSNFSQASPHCHEIVQCSSLVFKPLFHLRIHHPFRLRHIVKMGWSSLELELSVGSKWSLSGHT